MTVYDGGRLGNIMSQYATLYAYSKLLENITIPLLTKKMYRDLKIKMFPNISIKTYESEHCNRWFNWMDVKLDDRKFNMRQIDIGSTDNIPEEKYVLPSTSR